MMCERNRLFAKASRTRSIGNRLSCVHKTLLDITLAANSRDAATLDV